MKSYRDSLPNFAKPLVKLALILALLLVLPVAQVLAAEIEVNATCSLEQAIGNANSDSQGNPGCAEGQGTDTIILTGDVTLPRTPSAINSTIIIEGRGFTISGDNSTRVLKVDSGGNLTLNNMTITKGKADDGGGIYNSGTLTINNSTIQDNSTSSTTNGGGIYINSGTLTINNSTVRDNSSSSNGGGIYINSGTHTINNSTIERNKSKGAGGGIYIFGGKLTINNSTIADNTAEAPGGGIYSTATQNTANEITINNSTFADNRGAGGGAIYANSTKAITINNSTIAKNRATNSRGAGGGIYAASPFELTHVTMVNNTTNNDGAGLYIPSSNSYDKKIRNSILANNGNSDCELGNVNTPLTENVGNLIESVNCGGDVLTADPRLGSLTTGRPAYYPLLSGSPAIDAASSAHCLPEDQRGASRPYGSACDIGAFEWTPAEEECVGCPPPQQPFVRTTIALLPEIEVSDLTGFTEAQRIDAGGVGIQSVIDRGIVDAVDVWGFMGAGTRVCFLASGGSFSFLNAANSPRTVSSLPLYVIEGKTCTFIDGPGSVVLHPGAGSASNGPAWALSNCMVTTTDVLNFRDGPGGEVMGGVPYDVTLTALSRTAGWFEVDYHGTTGWISAQFVTPHGDCG